MLPKARIDFRKALLSWYEAHKRPLPWRHITDPYMIWVSEIILQQTTVDQGMPYYQHFAEAFPTVQALAAADEQEVLKLWQGLGYYSRARNMHKTAREIVEKYGGVFPDNYNAVIKLNGIGPYTAAAILSFAYGQPYPVADGNVMRVVSRLFAIEEAVNSSAGVKAVNSKVQELFDAENPGTFNQAMMEFGALHCRKHNPLCESCFANTYCEAFRKNIQQWLPVKQPPRKPTIRHFVYLVPVIEINGMPHTYLKKRTVKDIWHNLYDFPLFETTCIYTTESFIRSRIFKTFLKENKLKRKNISLLPFSKNITHKLTHRTIEALFIPIHLPALNLTAPYVCVPFGLIDQFPLPKLVENYLKTVFSK